MPIRLIKVESLKARILLLVLGLICLILVFFAIRWFLGNSISGQAETKEVAELSIGLSSGDPQPHLALAVLSERSFLPEDVPKSLEQYEKAAAVSPNDYRLWLALGKAREQNGNSKGAELALVRAVELAPNYAQVQWAYGNVLLRKGETEKAFVQIRKAVDGDPKFANPAATTVWQIFDGDIERIRKTIGNSNSVNSALATFLAKQKRFDEALSIWNSLPAAERRTTFKTDGQNIYAQLLNERKFKSAIKVRSQINSNGGGDFKIGVVHNGGFESPVNTKDPSVFEWGIGKGTKPQINIANNDVKSGNRSLLITCNITRRDEFRKISQTVALESGKSYEFEVFYKSKLDAAESMRWEIADANSGKVLASTDAIAKEANWIRLSKEFTTDEDSEGIIIRLVREGCESTICPLKGRVWFDDFSIR